QEKGQGRVVTIDNQSARDRLPDVSTLLAQAGLEDYVEVIFAQSSYTWELMKLVEEQTAEGQCAPLFDFCFIDGAHTWEADGLAFFLVEKLLNPGGWLLFDDLYWTYSSMEESPDTMPAEEQETSQVERVFSLLVCQHPSFHNHSIRDGWGWAQKRAPQEAGTATNVVGEAYAQQTIRQDIIAMVNKLRWRKTLKRLGQRNR
ncbi:class I SAM-dependent methyltransferase, partial [Candidatus Latescibacterota bacterium]